MAETMASLTHGVDRLILKLGPRMDRARILRSKVDASQNYRKRNARVWLLTGPSEFAVNTYRHMAELKALSSESRR